jgi:catecholate siderophore receptor
MNGSLSLRDYGSSAALGAGLAATLGGFLPADAWAQDAGSAELPQISIAGEGGSPNNTLQTPIGTSRLPGRVQDTPQTINVVPQEVLQQQAVTTLEQALRNVPGVTVSSGEGNGGMNGDQFRIRGFQAKNDLFVDGLRDFSVYQRDTFNTESVQVIKGPSSEAFGIGTIGAAVNQVTKRSFLGNAYVFDGLGGSGPLGRGTVDLNQQIDATTAVRLNAMVTQADIPDRNNVKSDRWGIALSAGFGIGTDTEWFLNYQHQHTDRTPDYGVPTLTIPGTNRSVPATEFGLARNTSFVRSTDRDESDVDLLTSLMKWQVNDWLTLNSDTRLTLFTRDFASTNPGACAATCATDFLAGRNPTITYGAGGGSAFRQNAWGIENVTSGTAKFYTGPLRHEAVFGVNYFYQDEDRSSLSVVGTRAPQNIRTPSFANTTGYSFVVNPTGFRNANSTDIGVFAQDRIWITEQLSVLGGIRYDDFSSRLRNSITAGAGTGQLGGAQRSDDGFVSPKASVIIEPWKDQIFYMTYAESTSPTGQYVVSGTAIEAPSSILPPEHSNLIEIGTKLNFLEGKLGVTGSLFRVTKTGSFDVDPITGNVIGGVLDAGEGREVRGAEVGVTGNLTEQWSVQLAYARLHSEVTETTTVANIGNEVAYVPRDNFSLYTTYNVAPDLAIPGKLLVGGGVFYSSSYFTSSDNLTKIPGNFSIDSVVSYEVNNLRFALNGYNLTDELNYSSAFNGRATPTSGRTFLASVGIRF